MKIVSSFSLQMCPEGGTLSITPLSAQELIAALERIEECEAED